MENVGIGYCVTWLLAKGTTREYETSDQGVVILPHNYPEAIPRADGTPILIPEGEVEKPMIVSLYSIAITGRPNINHELYSEEAYERTVLFAQSKY